MSDVHERELVRFVESVALGQIADEVFVEACAAAGVDPAQAVSAPLDSIAAALAARETRH